MRERLQTLHAFFAPVEPHPSIRPRSTDTPSGWFASFPAGGLDGQSRGEGVRPRFFELT